MFKTLDSFSESLTCGKVDLLANDPEQLYEVSGRQPQSMQCSSMQCISMACEMCGFRGPDGIPPSCPVIEAHKDLEVEWTRFEDVRMDDGSVVKKQQVPVKGTLQDLWAEFKKHTEKVSPMRTFCTTVVTG